MPQTVQVLRTLTNNAPPALPAGALSVELGGHTKLWLGSHTGNRLLISDNPAEAPVAGAGYLAVTGGTLSGDLVMTGGPTLRMGLVNTDPNSVAGGIEMHPGFGGFGVTGGTLNYNWIQTHQFISGGVPIMQLHNWGMQMQSALYLLGDPSTPTMAASKNYVDTLVGAVEAVTTLAGSYDVAADMVRPVPGVAVAGPLPAPVADNKGWYLIIEAPGIGSGNAPPVEMSVGDWLISNGEDWVHLFLNLETVEAANVGILPIPGLTSTNVQGALEELPTKGYVDAHDPAVGNYLPIGGGNLLGQLGVAGAGISYNGSNLVAFSWTGSALAASVDGSGSPGALATQQYALDQDAAIYTWTSANFLALGGGLVNGQLEVNSPGDFGAGANAGLIVSSDSEAVLAFNRTGIDAVKIGLDGLNRFAIGGWAWPPAIFTLDRTGQLSVTGAVNAPYFNGTHLQGGVNNSGTLIDASGRNHSVNFRYDDTQVMPVLNWRVDNAIEVGICSQTNAGLLNLAGGFPNPTTVALGVYDRSTVLYYIFCDDISDARIKANIAPTQVDALAVLRALDVDEFDVNADAAAWVSSTGQPMEDRVTQMAAAQPAHVSIGFVAQKIQALIPESVRATDQSRAAPECPLPVDTLSYATPPFTPYIVRAIQQLAAEVDQLMTTVDQLRGA